MLFGVFYKHLINNSSLSKTVMPVPALALTSKKSIVAILPPRSSGILCALHKIQLA